MTAMTKQTITVLGSTGSIGVSTLDVVKRHPDQFDVFALTANRSIELLAEQCNSFNPAYAVVGDADSAAQLVIELNKFNNCNTEVLYGVQSLVDVACAAEVSTVMAAIVGAAGLVPTLGAVKSGKKVLLANKEALVMAGRLFMDAVHESGAVLLPIDSEHNAIFQCMPAGYASGAATKGIRKLILTGSGGPFRTWSASAIAQATPDQACNHPNWSMGRKISVDSATLMNKGLEFIEARWLFEMEPERIQVVIHPQSIIHSMVEYDDGSVLAQLGNPDMRTPIAHALAWPERIESGVSSLDIIAQGCLDFESPKFELFPALGLAMEAASAGQGAATILNAANEVAVAAFLDQQIGFRDISDLLIDIMSSMHYGEPDSIEAVLALDEEARCSTVETLQRLHTRHISL